jgi:hypothetical protein
VGRRATSQQRFKAPRHRPATARRRRTRNPSFDDQTVYTATVTNNGTIESAPSVSKTGVTGPTTAYFENATQAKTVWVNVPSGTGTLAVDFATRTVTFAGSTLTDVVTEASRWWTLSAGANTIRYEPDELHEDCPRQRGADEPVPREERRRQVRVPHPHL